MELRARSVTIAYGGEPAVLREVDFDLGGGRFVCLLGPNGAGKSTLLRALCGLQSISSGSVEYDGRPLHTLRASERARCIGFLPQEVQPAFSFTVEEAVALGAHVAGHGSWFETRLGAETRDAVRRALEQVDAQELMGRPLARLSGGERRRVLVASVLAQEPRVLLLDEPAAMLDLHHQAWLFALLRDCARDGLAVCCVTHDLNLASAFADELAVLHRGGVARRGPPASVLEAGVLHEVFGDRLQLLPREGAPPAVLPR